MKVEHCVAGTVAPLSPSPTGIGPSPPTRPQYLPQRWRRPTSTCKQQRQLKIFRKPTLAVTTFSTGLLPRRRPTEVTSFVVRFWAVSLLTRVFMTKTTGKSRLHGKYGNRVLGRIPCWRMP
ncbi:hypothetical protein C0Q70_01619 [Pomacea canaliculata]|uniref:Uncharacterized protein n=1 Tax=Pomacea canaliculata TaxID=400727 RepID=A0A2T7PZZ7_POMCA|nr:hypothetical protein C0Q70_01619 [Pomacea canaliculata]